MKTKITPPVKVNDVLKLAVRRFGKEGDPIFFYKNFIIFLKSKEKVIVNLNEFIEIRITKVMPKFAIAIKTNR